MRRSGSRSGGSIKVVAWVISWSTAPTSSRGAIVRSLSPSAEALLQEAAATATTAAYRSLVQDAVAA